MEGGNIPSPDFDAKPSGKELIGNFNFWNTILNKIYLFFVFFVCPNTPPGGLKQYIRFASLTPIIMLALHLQ